MEIADDNDHCKNSNCHLMNELGKSNLSEIPTSSFNCFMENRKFRFSSVVANSAITARLFPFWKLSVVRKYLTNHPLKSLSKPLLLRFRDLALICCDSPIR